MFLMQIKNILLKNKPSYLLRRVSASTTGRDSTKQSTEYAESKKDVEVHKTLSEDEIQKIINLDNIYIVTKFQQKQPQRPPLVKDFFIGKIDIQHLTYPQVMEVKQINELVEQQQPIINYFSDSARTPDELRFRDVSNQMLADFRSMKLFGTSVHQRYGGSGLFKSEMNLASESEAEDIKSFMVLAGHRLAVEAISDHGNVSHQNQYLMEMAKGEIIGAVCLHDPLNKDWATGVKISKTHDGDYVLNGTKSFATLSQHANVLVVIAEKSDELKKESDIEIDDADDEDFFDTYMTVVLDPHSSGISIVDHGNTIGCNDVPFVTVDFTNVRIGRDQILGEGIDDRTTSKKLIASSRLQAATLNMIQAKNMLSHLTQFTINSSCNSEKLRDLVYVRQNLARIACDLYGLESMIYLSAGIIDQYDNPKVDMECALNKAYSQDILRNLTELAMNLVTNPITIAGHPIDLNIRDAIQLQHIETSRALKSYVGRLGVQHSSDFFGKGVSDYKDSIWTKFNFTVNPIDEMDVKHYLGDYLHPSFKAIADELEYSIRRMQMSTEILLKRHGDSVFQQHSEIESLGEAALQNYAMFASIGRASRSYCIGLRYAVYETIVAASLVERNSKKIFKMAKNIKNNEGGYAGLQRNIAEHVIKKHRMQSITVPSVLHSGVIRKTVK